MTWYPKKGLSRNKYWTSDGVAYTQRQIDRKRSEAYIREHECGVTFWCEGCGQLAQCHAHIIPQARCKQIRKTELIWNKNNWFKSCFRCNASIENPKGEAWKSLKNIQTCLQFIQQHDQELFQKFMNTCEMTLI